MMRVIAGAALLLLAGCGPLVQVGSSAPPPDALLTLSAAAPASVPVGTQPVAAGQAVSVSIPDVPGTLRTLRIPVTVSDTEVQYVKAAVWAEQPNRLFQRLLADTIANAGVPVIDARSVGTAADRRLTGQLLAFGVDTKGPSPMVRVRYDASLTSPDGLRQRRFEREAPLARVDGPAAAGALNQAANALAGDVARWLAGTEPGADTGSPR
jgi:cholesterol transport system auxiliary component